VVVVTGVVVVVTGVVVVVTGVVVVVTGVVVVVGGGSGGVTLHDVEIDSVCQKVDAVTVTVWGPTWRP
jgi:hypothetical protein